MWLVFTAQCQRCQCGHLLLTSVSSVGPRIDILSIITIYQHTYHNTGYYINCCILQYCKLLIAACSLFI